MLDRPGRHASLPPVSSNDTTPSVTCQIHDDTAVVTMDDGKANAISKQTLVDFHAALDQAEGTAALVIAGRPGKFCAGFDLAVVQEGPQAAVDIMNQGGMLSLRLHEWPTPRVLAVTGHALAMGAVLLACADLRIGAVGDFKYGLNEVAIGLALPRFAIELHRARMARKELHQATVLSKIYDPRGALEAGLIDELVDAGGIVDHAVSRAAEIADYVDAAAFVRTRETAYAELTGYLRKEFGS